MKNVKVNIGGYTFDVEFTKPSEMPGFDGKVMPNEMKILVRNDLSETATKLIVAHEVVHAILDTQGRVYQRKFELEDVCEFVAYRLDEINVIVNGIMEEAYK